MWHKSCGLLAADCERRKRRFYPQLVYRLHQHADVVAKHLTKSLFDLPRVALAPQRTPEQPYNHRVGGFDVRALVVVLQKVIALVHEVAVHLGWTSLYR